MQKYDVYQIYHRNHMLPEPEIMDCKKKIIGFIKEPVNFLKQLK